MSHNPTSHEPLLVDSFSIIPPPTALGTHKGPSSYGSTHNTTNSTPAHATKNDTLALIVDRPSTPQVSVHSYTSTQSRHRPVSLVDSEHASPGFTFTSRAARFKLYITQTFSFLISSFFLSFIVIWACLSRLAGGIPTFLRHDKPAVYSWDNPELYKIEKVTKDVQSYAKAVGFDIVDGQVETADGYYLRVHRVMNPRHKQNAPGKGGIPVLVLHGLFQSSGSFITSEERSLAFWLSERGGYQIFLGNTRGVFNMGHRHFSRSDPQFWDWTIRELAMYDFPALVDYVRDETGYDKIAFIGHSQGNGIGFISLSEGMRPELGDKLLCFIALAPAVFAGPLTQGLLFTTLSKMGWGTWKCVFGVLDFIPLMQWSYDYVHPNIFAFMGYTMFAYLFQWTDANWLKRRKTKMFRFTPSPVSSASIFWWCGKGGFANRRCTMDVSLSHWWTPHFPPLSLFYGGKDFLVDVEPLLERLRTRECVNVMRVEKVDVSEHCDFYWAADAVDWCFGSILNDIEQTSLRDREIRN